MAPTSRIFYFCAQIAARISTQMRRIRLGRHSFERLTSNPNQACVRFRSDYDRSQPGRFAEVAGSSIYLWYTSGNKLMPAIYSMQMQKSRPPVQWLTMACFSAALMLCACSSGGESTSNTNTSPPSPVNTPPVISGSPPTFVIQDEPYAFAPTAADGDRDTLTFAIAKQPAWAAFNGSTGGLTGTPTASDIGTTLASIISVSDGTASASLPPFDLEVGQIQLGSAMVFWDAPATNAGGSQITNLGGFCVYCGMASGNYKTVLDVREAAAVSLLIDELEPDTYFFEVSALDSSGNESALSTEVSKVVAP